MSVASVLVCLSCFQATSGIKWRANDAFVPDPTPEGFAKAKARNVDTYGMVPLSEVGLRGGRNVTILGYQAKEDVEISGSLAGGTWETFHMAHLCDPWATAGALGNFLDVGANIGTYTLPMAQCIEGKGAVLSIEGMPSIADHLRAGIVANEAQNVALYGYAVGDGSPLSHITMALDPKNKGGSSVVGNKPGAPELAQFTVPLTTLDAILHNDPRMTAILSAKVDIEGNEGRMLKGAQEFFSKHPPCYLTIELISEWLASAGTPLEGILDQLRGFGYAYVPDLDYMTHRSWRAKTIHVLQKDLDTCLQRVYKAAAAVDQTALAADQVIPSHAEPRMLAQHAGKGGKGRVTERKYTDAGSPAESFKSPW